MKYTSFVQLYRSNKFDEYNKLLENTKIDHCYHEIDINLGKNKAFFSQHPIFMKLLLRLKKFPITKNFGLKQINSINRCSHIW
jgi:hypothetical protein